MDQQFACGHSHTLMAWDSDGKPVDLEGHFCPLCLGKIDGYGDIIDSRFLAPVQPEAPILKGDYWPHP